jgi:hypothetical protein
MPESIRRGSNLFVRATLRDDTQGGKRFDPDTSVEVTITQPDGTPEVSLAAMTRLQLGVFGYEHQTAEDDPVGDWTAALKVVHDGRTSLSLPETFTLVA